MPEPKLPVARSIQQVIPAASWHFCCKEGNAMPFNHPLVAWVLTADNSQPPNYKLEGAYAESDVGSIVQLCEDNPGFQYYLLYPQ